MEKKWSELSPEEKREDRFKRWLSPSGVKFDTPAAEKLYKERVTRLVAAVKLKKPDRVPTMMPGGFVAAACTGVPLGKTMYDYDELCRVTMQFLQDFETDMYHGPDLAFPGKVFERIGYISHKWPGHGLAPDAPTYQFVEGEYMKPDEYDSLINDPTDFWLRIYLPRVAEALEPFKRLQQTNPLLGIPVGYLTSFGAPDVQAAFQALLDAGKESAKWLETVVYCTGKMLSMGIPLFWGGIATAPFDGIADMLRGTQGTVFDMFRQPDKLLKAIEAITPVTITTAVEAANGSGCPLIFIPLHKGADGWMSEKQFLKFYWPTFKEMCLGLINEGCVPLLFAEGGYNSRLEVVKDLPRGSVVWWFDQTDIFKAKEILGDSACICGNVPSSILLSGTPATVKEHCRKLIEVVGKNGGYILTSGAIMNQANPDNIRAMMAAAKEYGVYK
jgi:uroporphyrinogen-III decarboxylase